MAIENNGASFRSSSGWADYDSDISTQVPSPRHSIQLDDSSTFRSSSGWADYDSDISTQVPSPRHSIQSDNSSTRATISSFPGYIYNVRIIDPNTPHDFSHIQQLLLGNRPIPAVVIGYYQTLEQLAENVRLGTAHPPSTISTSNIRFYALHQSGSCRGFGADELLMTSKTYNFFRRTAGLVAGVRAYSILRDGTRFSWLDAQLQGRLPTAMVLLPNGHAHVGALYRNFLSAGVRGGQLTSGQYAFHMDRQAHVHNSTTPLLALYRALNFTRSQIPSTAEFLAGDMYTQATFNVFDEDIHNPEQRLRFAYDLEAIRNNMVSVLRLIKDQMSGSELNELGDQPSLQFSEIGTERVILEDLGLPPEQPSDADEDLQARKRQLWTSDDDEDLPRLKKSKLE